jgi:hypothetical protein
MRCDSARASRTPNVAIDAALNKRDVLRDPDEEN